MPGFTPLPREPAAELKGTLLLGEGNKFRSEWTYEGGVYPKVTFLYLSDGEKFVSIINGKKELITDRTAKMSWEDFDAACDDLKKLKKAGKSEEELEARLKEWIARKGMAAPKS